MAQDTVSTGASLPSSGTDARKRRVTYFHDPTIGNFYYGKDHPMRPHRIRIAHHLILEYGLHRHMDISRPVPASASDISLFHTPDYVHFLSTVTPETVSEAPFSSQVKHFNLDSDCPVFYGLFDFCQASSGGSIGAAVKLNTRDADIAINWAGGLHHARRYASGFCYVNDIVLGILELLKVHQRVLYVDIDVHHGDGVEEAFYTTDRVMTVSFHKFGNFFPGSGHIRDIGVSSGKYYAVNVPLNDGIDDKSFQGMFRPIIQKVMDVYRPDAVVLQCGADSLSGDRSFNVPLMVLGGGGYSMGNVARCWCYETAVAVDVQPDNALPFNQYYEYFGPDYTLHVDPFGMENLNKPWDLERIRNTLLEQLSKIQHAPSVPFQATPATGQIPEEEEEHMDVRPKQSTWKGVDYDSDPEQENESPQISMEIDPSKAENVEKRDVPVSVKEDESKGDDEPRL